MKELFKNNLIWLVISVTGAICAIGNLAISQDQAGPEALPAVLIFSGGFAVWAIRRK